MIRALAGASLVLVVAVSARDAGACSCMPPEPTLLSPLRSQDAPPNAKIRVEIGSYGGATVTPIVRVHGSGEKIEAKSRTISGRMLDVIELTPVAPLSPNTRYEVATYDAKQHPATHVLGAFKTGAATTNDTTAPRIEKMSAAFAERSGQLRTSCSVPGPWIMVNDVAASDPGRPSASLVYGVWLGDANGSIDATKPPTRILTTSQGSSSLVIGQASSCHFQDFPIPSTPFAWIGIAAIDEAGNQSALKKMRVDLAGAKSPP